MRVSVVLLAAGLGKRMGGKTPKAFLKLGGLPLYRHSMDVFKSMKEVRQVILVVPKGVKGGIEGGSRRQDSVRNGLGAVDPASDVVLIHDAARPFVTPELVRRVIQGTMEHGGAIPGVPVRDTLKRMDSAGHIEATVDRSVLWAAQTPQGFKNGVLEAAYASGHGLEDASDDAQIVERAGGRVAIVDGNPENFKITSKSDLDLAEDYLRRRRSRTSRGTPGPHHAVAPKERRRTPRKRRRP
ncbi:MAG TPA: 2-C-methyl-D-erythritol 4-phosphate cytidylyltransferase [Planctomycetota bacterium]|nr:2-C-methyl-D-erythritol 4-phosphate cytidylyltransferase [Planctomycetota bacterium]